MKVKKVIYQLDNKKFHWETVYTSNKIIDMPYPVGKMGNLFDGLTPNVDDTYVPHSIFNESNIARIDLVLGKYEAYFLVLRQGYELSEIHVTPSSISVELLVAKQPVNTYMYSFYNNTDTPNISIIAKLVKMDSATYSKIKSNLSDIALRQYLLKKMFAKRTDIEDIGHTKDIVKQNMSLEAVAKYLNRSKGTIYNWVYKKKIPFHKTGRSLLFRKDEIDKWITDGEKRKRK